MERQGTAEAVELESGVYTARTARVVGGAVFAETVCAAQQSAAVVGVEAEAVARNARASGVHLEETRSVALSTPRRICLAFLASYSTLIYGERIRIDTMCFWEVVWMKSFTLEVQLSTKR